MSVIDTPIIFIIYISLRYHGEKSNEKDSIYHVNITGFCLYHWISVGYDRVTKANEANANIFLSINANAGINGGSGGGICVFVSGNASVTSKLLQDAVYAAAVAKTGLVGNRAEPKPVKSFYVIANTDMPAILGEYGFMDSTVDTPIILTDDFARKCANGIVEGVVKVLSLAKRDVVTTPATTTDVGNVVQQLMDAGITLPDLLKAIADKI